MPMPSYAADASRLMMARDSSYLAQRPDDGIRSLLQPLHWVNMEINIEKLAGEFFL
jgi:hypothetical protein